MKMFSFHVLSAALCAMFLAQGALAATYTVKTWSGGSSANRFTSIVGKLKAGDVVEFDDDIWFRSAFRIDADGEVTFRSAPGKNITLINAGRTYGCTVYPGSTLTISNLTIDCEDASQQVDLFHLKGMEVQSSWSGNVTTNISRLVLQDGAVIKNVYLKSSSGAENAAIHVKTGAVLRINSGAMIQNCNNQSNPGKGGAICCDYGTVIMTGGTITGCNAKGAGGAIHTDGTRVDNTDNYGISSRGDVYISGGYITNNTCGAGLFGGGIYLGNTGPMLHVTGTAVISNNFSGTGDGRVPDDVSTYDLDDRYVNRLKLVNHIDINPPGFSYEGIRFTGWVGVRYPNIAEITEPQHSHFGAVWEYFDGSQEEARQFFWNGDNEYRGRIDGNVLIWSRHIVHELPKDGKKVVELIATGESPIYMELSQNYKMSQPAVVPSGVELILDLKGFDLECDFHVSNDTARVTILDSSTNKTGTVTGHRESDHPNAFVLDGGSYHTLPKPEWVASNRVVIGNYCEKHPYMVAAKAWEAKEEGTMTDLTNVPLHDSDNEVREVTMIDGVPDIGRITFSSGDWKYMQYTNMKYRVQVLAAPAVQDSNGDFSEAGPRVKLYDSHEQADVSPLNDAVAPSNGAEPETYGREDDFAWDAASSRGLVKLIHITMEEMGERYRTNDAETAYFRFPEAAFKATQRKTNGQLPITVVDSLLTALGYNRAEGLQEDHVNTTLDAYGANGLRKWENIVTGTAENHLLLSTATGSDDGLALNVALSDAEKVSRTDTGYSVKYDIRKSTAEGWASIGEIMDEPRFSVPLLDNDGKSVDATGFYRITTLIINDKFSVTNEIPSTNIVGVLEVASTLTNTLSAVPWVALGEDPSKAEVRPVTVSNYVHTPHLGQNDSVQVADRGHIYRRWEWNKGGKKWDGAISVTRNAVVPASEASEQNLQRNSAVWVTRNDPAARPFFLIGQYSDTKQTLTIEAGTTDNVVCTLVPNPSLKSVKVNDYKWNGNPMEGDMIRIPNEKKSALVLRWKNGAWGRIASGKWKTDTEVPAGTGFWYMRCGAAFEVELPDSAPASE